MNQELARDIVVRQRALMKAYRKKMRGTNHEPGMTKALPAPASKVKRKMSKSSRRKNR